MVVTDDRGRWVGRPGVIVRVVGLSLQHAGGIVAWVHSPTAYKDLTGGQQDGIGVVPYRPAAQGSWSGRLPGRRRGTKIKNDRLGTATKQHPGPVSGRRQQWEQHRGGGEPMVDRIAWSSSHVPPPVRRWRQSLCAPPDRCGTQHIATWEHVESWVVVDVMGGV